MIREILTYLTEKPKLSEAKSFGHLKESIALTAREERCRNAWLPHRTQCKDFIASNIKNAKHFESVLVLGSGPLHEVPIEELSKKFNKVVLVDVVHLKSTKKSIKHLKNIVFIEHEISEIESTLKKEKELISKIPVTFTDEDWGLVCSVNIMSQLPIHLDSYIKMKLKNKFSEEKIKDYLESVTANHLLYLKSFDCPTLLITDIETTYYDRAEKVLQIDLNYNHLTFPDSVSEWFWNVAPIPEFDKDIGMKMRVCTFLLNSRK